MKVGIAERADRLVAILVMKFIDQGKISLDDKIELNHRMNVLNERLDSLKLSRSRLLEQLERARRPAHRNVLLNGLKALEREIEEVSVKVP
mgnify:CR=1 FL=1